MARVVILLAMWTLGTLVPSGLLGRVAGATREVEPNNSLTEAQNLDGLFVIQFDPNVGDINGLNTSATIPHVTVEATGDGTFDYFSFTVSHAGLTGIFDIDYGWLGTGAIDTELFLFDQQGNLLAEDDDTPSSSGAGGSVASNDAFLQYVFSVPGQYIIGVGEYSSSAETGGITGNWPDIGDLYTLQVSLETVAPVGGAVSGDYNGDRVVDAADYTVWRDTLGSSGLSGDLRANGDNTGASANVIDEADYFVWKQNFGTVLNPPAAVVAASGHPVPEPASWLVLALALPWGWLRRPQLVFPAS